MIPFFGAYSLLVQDLLNSLHFLDAVPFVCIFSFQLVDKQWGQHLMNSQTLFGHDENACGLLRGQLNMCWPGFD